MNRRPRLPRCQDYVIKDGRLVGDFEAMYQDFEDPWDQSQSEHDAIDKRIGLDLLAKYGHGRALEFGCGLGQYTAQLHTRLGAAAGVDISRTAIARAQQLHPHPTFFVGDVLSTEPAAAFRPDVLVFSQITWYVLDKLSAFKQGLTRQGAGAFLHLLEVYPPEGQSYGKDYFTDLAGIMDYWSDVIDFREWGLVSRKEDVGGARTFFYGAIK